MEGVSRPACTRSRATRAKRPDTVGSSVLQGPDGPVRRVNAQPDDEDAQDVHVAGEQVLQLGEPVGQPPAQVIVVHDTSHLILAAMNGSIISHHVQMVNASHRKRKTTGARHLGSDEHLFHLLHRFNFRTRRRVLPPEDLSPLPSTPECAPSSPPGSGAGPPVATGSQIAARWPSR